MKVVLIGKGLMLSNMILAAVECGCEIVGVLRYERTCQSGLKTFLNDLFNEVTEATLIRKFKLKELYFKSVNCEKFRQFLIKNNVDLMFVGTWREKIQKETFDIPTIASINIHPSLLPKYRGPNPYIQTILHGEEYSGVTLHLIDENYDTGSILAQEKVKIAQTDTSKELREKTVVSARNLIKEFIFGLNEKITTPIKQSEKHSSYYKNITGDEKMLDFSSQTSEEITRTVRALHPFLPCYITYKNNFFIANPYKMEIVDFEQEITPNSILEKDAKNSSLTISCKDGKCVKFSDLKLYGAKFLTKFYISKFVKTEK